ncbi:hypothetical protein, partial [Phytoactinopolyspora halophila]
MTRTKTQGRRAARVVVATTAASACAVGASLVNVAAAPPDEEGMGSFNQGATGSYFKVGVSLLGDDSLIDIEDLNGQVRVGAMDTDVDSDGLPEERGDNVNSYAYAALAQVEGLGIGPEDFYEAEQSAPPQQDEPEATPGEEVDLGALGSIRLINGMVKANWDDEFIAPGVDGELAWTDASTIDLSFLDLENVLDTGGLIDLPFEGSLASFEGGEIQTTGGTEVKEDGSLAAYSEISGEFAATDFFGGVENGGISIGIVPGGSEEDQTARIRAYANGEPGGARIDGGEEGTEPQIPLLALYVPCSTGLPELGDHCGVELNLNASEEINLPSDEDPLVSVRATFADTFDEEVAEDGTSARFSFGGIELDFSVFLPSLLEDSLSGMMPTQDLQPTQTELFDGTAQMMSFDDVWVEVPEGGIYPDDGDEVEVETEADAEVETEADAEVETE